MSLQMGKIEEANEVLLKAREILHCVENSVGYNPMRLLSMKASILSLYVWCCHVASKQGFFQSVWIVTGFLKQSQRLALWKAV